MIHSTSGKIALLALAAAFATGADARPRNVAHPVAATAVVVASPAPVATAAAVASPGFNPVATAVIVGKAAQPDPAPPPPPPPPATVPPPAPAPPQ
jgi:hypothetical protein